MRTKRLFIILMFLLFIFSLVSGCNKNKEHPIIITTSNLVGSTFTPTSTVIQQTAISTNTFVPTFTPTSTIKPTATPTNTVAPKITPTKTVAQTTPTKTVAQTTPTKTVGSSPAPTPPKMPYAHYTLKDRSRMISIADVLNIINGESEYNIDNESTSFTIESRVLDEYNNFQHRIKIDVNLTIDFSIKVVGENLYMKVTTQINDGNRTSIETAYYGDGYCYQDKNSLKTKCLITPHQFIEYYLSNDESIYIPPITNDDMFLCYYEYESDTIDKYTVDIKPDYINKAFPEPELKPLKDRKMHVYLYLNHNKEFDYLQTDITFKGKQLVDAYYFDRYLIISTTQRKKNYIDFTIPDTSLFLETTELR